MQLIDVADEVREDLGLFEAVRDLFNSRLDLLQFVFIKIFDINLFPMYFALIVLLFLLRLALKLTHAQMRTQYVNPL